MNVSTFSWSKEWEFGFRIWLNRSGQPVLGRGRAQLLSAIDRTNSISAAARDMKMSYRHAWLMVQEVNERAGAPLVEAAVGGKRGGGAQLTPYGRQAIAFFESLQSRIDSDATRTLQDVVKRPEKSASLRVAADLQLQAEVSAVVQGGAGDAELPVRPLFGSSQDLVNHILEGACFDLFLTTDSASLKSVCRFTTMERVRCAARGLYVAQTKGDSTNDQRVAALLSSIIHLRRSLRSHEERRD